jgi:hypothetical protein
LLNLLKGLQLRQTEAVLLYGDALSFHVGELEESPIELEIVYYLAVILIEVFPIEDFVVFQIDLYLLVHFAQLDLDIEFPLVHEGLHLIASSLPLNAAREYNFLIRPGGSILCDIGASELLLRAIVWVFGVIIEEFGLFGE